MSKFCGNCGAQLEDSVMFCGACGAKQEAPTQQAPVQQPVQQAPVQPQAVMPQVPVQPQAPFAAVPAADGSIATEKKPMSPETKKTIGIVAVISAVVILLGIIAGVIIHNATKYQKIDVEDLFMITCEGVNGSATVEIKFATPENVRDEVRNGGMYYEEYRESEYYNEEDGKEEFILTKSSKWFNTERKDMKKAWDKFDSVSDIKKAQEKLMQYVELEVDEESLKNLSNGDTIEIKVKIKEEKLKNKNIKIEGTSFTYTVEGLVEPEVLEPWNGINVTFEGFNGEAEAIINTDGVDAEMFNFFNYRFSTDNYDLSNGDVVTVELRVYYSLNNGYFIHDEKFYTYDDKVLTKDFTVSGLKELSVIDPFEGVTFDYSEKAPTLTAKLNTDACPQYIKDCIEFDWDYNALRNLNIGDEFTITATVSYWAEDEFASLGYKLATEEVTKTFVVPDNVPKYIQDVNQIKKVDTETFMKPVYDEINGEIGDDYIGALRLDGKIAKIDAITLTDAYLVAPVEVASKSNTYYQTGSVKMTLDVDGANKSKTIYFVAMFDSAYIDANGELFHDDYWILYNCANSMEEIKAQYINTPDNKAQGKVMTSTAKVPNGDTPVEDKPAEDTPVEDAPTTDAPAEDTPAEDAPTTDAPAEDAPAQAA